MSFLRAFKVEGELDRAILFEAGTVDWCYLRYWMDYPDKDSPLLNRIVYFEFCRRMRLEMDP